MPFYEHKTKEHLRGKLNDFSPGIFTSLGFLSPSVLTCWRSLAFCSSSSVVNLKKSDDLLHL